MTQLKQRIAVPRLSDTSRQRIRNEVFAQLDQQSAVPAARPARSRHQLAMWGAAAAACALIGAGAAHLLGARETGERSAAAPRLSRVATGDSASQFSLSGAELTVAAHSALTVSESTDGAVQIVLETGRVDCAVAPREGRPPFVVAAADVRVQVVGTRFAVTRKEAAVEVTVEKGKVRVSRADESALVGAGERWSSKPPAPPLSPTRPAPPQDEAMEMEPLVLDPREPPRRGPDTAKDRAADSVPPPAADARARYEAAAKLEATQPRAALDAYRKLAVENNPWAANALFAQARLERALGHAAAARRLLKAYLAKYPDGANAPLARQLLAQ